MTDPGNTYFYLSIFDNDSGVLGQELWHGRFSSQLLPGYGGVLHLEDLGGPLLSAGEQYWLLAEGSDTKNYSWWTNVQGVRGPMALYQSNIGWMYYESEINRAMRIGVVPEPEMLTLGWVVAAIFVTYRRNM